MKKYLKSFCHTDGSPPADLPPATGHRCSCRKDEELFPDANFRKFPGIEDNSPVVLWILGILAVSAAAGVVLYHNRKTYSEK